MEKFSDEVSVLVAQSGPLEGQRYALLADTLVGRDQTCHIVITDRQVSRQHTRFFVTPQGIKLEDLKSKNGTHLNGIKIQESTMLQDGDVIQIALAQKFVFISSDATLPLNKEQEYLLELEPRGATERNGLTSSRLRLDQRSRRVWIVVSDPDKPSQEIEILPPLSVFQFRLLEILFNNPGRVVSRPDLVMAVWSDNLALEVVSEQALDALVRRLRDRISARSRFTVG